MSNKIKGFTLIELLVVVAIIGILAAVGIVAYSGYTSSAKISATKANFKLVTKFTKTETMKCEIHAEFIFDNTVNCSANAGSNLAYQDANHMKSIIIDFFQDKIKNHYTGGKGIVQNGGIPNNDKEIGEIHIHQSQNPETLQFMVCFKSPCENADNRIISKINLPS